MKKKKDKKLSPINILPAAERPYEKYEKLGARPLSDAELLAIILRSGTKGCSCLELARTVLSKPRTEQGLLGLHILTTPELTEIPGIGPVKAMQLKCIGELCRRMAEMPHQDGIRLTDPLSIASRYMEQMRHMQQEHVLLLLLDSKCKLLHELTLSIGSVNQSILTPREVFIAAFQYQAVNLILLHNHPSGDPQPSKADLYSTQRVREVGEMVGIPLMDHIIIGDNQYISLKEQGLM